MSRWNAVDLSLSLSEPSAAVTLEEWVHFDSLYELQISFRDACPIELLTADPYLRQGGYFFTDCLFVGLRKQNCSNDFHKIRWKGGTWDLDETFGFVG